MSTKILVKYFGPTSHGLEMREMAYWRATAVCVVINKFEAANPLPPNVVFNDPMRAAALLRAISEQLWEYGIVTGPRWWQRGMGKWQEFKGDSPAKGSLRFDGWDRPYKAWLMVSLEHDPAPSFEVRRQDYGLPES